MKIVFICSPHSRDDDNIFFFKYLFIDKDKNVVFCRETGQSSNQELHVPPHLRHSRRQVQGGGQHSLHGHPDHPY